MASSDGSSSIASKSAKKDAPQSAAACRPDRLVGVAHGGDFTPRVEEIPLHVHGRDVPRTENTQSDLFHSRLALSLSRLHRFDTGRHRSTVESGAWRCER